LGSLFFAFLYFLGSRDYKLVETKLSMEKSEQTRLNMEAQKKEKITVGYQPVCPFCMADVVNPSSGLTHCLKCGKQFHYSNECSYPVKFK
jgi:tRNA(Ile2) C34 agmatinyltransferase TiaS